jgi:hypothetical protein
MGLKDELRDPWGLVVGGVSGGLAWALLGAAATAPVALAAGAGVGAVVYGAKVLTGLLTGGSEPERRDDEPLPRPSKSSAAGTWFERAERAVRSLDRLAATAQQGAAGEAVRAAAEDAHGALRELARIGAQVAAVEAAEARVDAHGLEEEAERLDSRARSAASPELAAEVSRAAAAVRDRLAVARRLDEARDTLVARMEATALGLEGLVARLAEVLALTATTGGVDTTAQDVAELTAELDGLRAGLAESEALSRRALAAAPPPEPGGPDRQPG